MKFLQKTRFISAVFLGLVFSIFVGFSEKMPLKAAETSLGNAIPTYSWQDSKLPDWSQISFSGLPAIAESGAFYADAEAVSQLGYDPSRNWMAGQKPESFLTLGDFQDSLKLENLSLNDLAALVRLDLNSLTLDRIGVMPWQTLNSLVKAIPGLGERRIREVPPIAELLAENLTTGVDPDRTVSQLLEASPLVGEQGFSSLALAKYRFDSIPGIEAAPLGSFRNWQLVKIDAIPGLKDVPFSKFPNPISAVGSETGIVDIAFGPSEERRDRAISGSDVEGFSVACEVECAHIELSGNSAVLGKQWISGKSQLVRGGRGILAAVNGGKEPTGRHPFGNTFKVVIWDISEPEGTVSTALFFRICAGILGCSPYFIGPVPFMNFREGAPMFLGIIEPGHSGSVSTPTGASNGGERSTFDKNAAFNEDSFTGGIQSNANSYLQPIEKGDCSTSHRGVVLDAIGSALSEIEGNYSSVGAYACDRAGNCGRGLGAKQFMSYREDARRLIASKPGGEQFLSRLDSGEPVNGEEMLLYFSPKEQESLFRADVLNLIERSQTQVDPVTEKPFSGMRLVERVAQMHYAGPGISIDSNAADVHQGLSVKAYGERAATHYREALQAMGCF